MGQSKVTYAINYETRQGAIRTVNQTFELDGEHAHKLKTSLDMYNAVIVELDSEGRLKSISLPKKTSGF